MFTIETRAEVYRAISSNGIPQLYREKCKDLLRAAADYPNASWVVPYQEGVLGDHRVSLTDSMNLLFLAVKAPHVTFELARNPRSVSEEDAKRVIGSLYGILNGTANA